MATYSAVITIESTPALQISGAGISYEQIKNSLGNYNYLLLSLFVQCQSIDQLLLPVNFQTYDSNGTQNQQVYAPSVDPYQKQSAVSWDIRDAEIVINGRTVVSMIILPFENISIIFSSMRNYVAEYLELKNLSLAQG